MIIVTIMKKNLFKNFLSFSSLTFLSRILGFLRDTIIARYFGASFATDAFFVAFKIPNLLRRITAEGAFTQAFVPITADYKKLGRVHLHAFFNKISSLLALALVIITLVGIFASPWIVMITAPGFSDNPEQFNMTVDLLRITFPYILFISLVAMAGAILNSFEKFAVTAFSPVLLNVSFILAAIYFKDMFENPIYVLAWAVFFGGILQLILQIPFIKSIGWSPRIDFDIQDSGVRRVLRLMGPAILGVSIIQISLLINTIFASFLTKGSVSWLYYADRLMEFPAGVLGVALSTVLLPSLSKNIAQINNKKFNETLHWGLRFGFFVSVPAAIALGVMSGPLVFTLFHYGKFSVLDAEMTQKALIAYSIGLIGLIMVKVLAPAFYSQKDIKTPVKIAVITLFVTQFMNLVLINLLQHAGLALAIGIGACLNAFLLFYFLIKKHHFKIKPDLLIDITRIILASILMGLFLFFITPQQNFWIDANMTQKIIHTSMYLCGGFCFYLFILSIIGAKLKKIVTP